MIQTFLVGSSVFLMFLAWANIWDVLSEGFSGWNILLGGLVREVSAWGNCFLSLSPQCSLRVMGIYVFESG